jgi:hypothetical protein
MPPDLLAGLPGEALLREGLADFQSGRCTVPACLVAIARTRLARAGLISGDAAPSVPEPERQLYRLLRAEGGDAYSRYNALIRELVSFEQALEKRLNSRKQKAEIEQGKG